MLRFEKKSIGFWVLNQYLAEGFPLHRNEEGKDGAREGNGRFMGWKRNREDPNPHRARKVGPRDLICDTQRGDGHSKELCCQQAWHIPAHLPWEQQSCHLTVTVTIQCGAPKGPQTLPLLHLETGLEKLLGSPLVHQEGPNPSGSTGSHSGGEFPEGRRRRSQRL